MKQSKNTRSSTPADKQIGDRIRSQRIVRKMSQEQLGNCLGVTFQQIQKYEKGVNRVSGARLVTLAEALKTSISALLDAPIGGNDREMASIMQFMTTPEGVRLAKAYMKVPKGQGRHTIIAMVEHMAAA